MSAPLKIAVPNKGRLSEQALELLSKAGLHVPLHARSLLADVNGQWRLLFVRTQDIPEYVATGSADAGITGLDLVAEHGASVETLLFPQIAQDFGFEITAMEVAVEHVHLFLSFPPKFSIAKVVGILKSISASILFREEPELKQQLWSGQFWEDGYFARTVGDEVTATVIKRYITSHREKEKKPRELKLF